MPKPALLTLEQNLPSQGLRVHSPGLRMLAIHDLDLEA